MTSSIPSTPRNNNNQNTFRTPRRLCGRSLTRTDTPEGPNNVEPFSSIKRRVSKEKLNEISNLLTVAVRVRPMNARELNCSAVYDTVTVRDNEIIVKIVPPGGTGIGMNHMFQYDHTFGVSDGQQELFQTLGLPMLDNAFKGYNACLFAYGQTGSGKSYSMMGENCCPDNEATGGIIPRFCYELFERISHLPASSTTVELSYFEIYNEKIYDLLTVPACTPDKRTALKVREHPVWGPYVVNLNPHVVKSFNEVRDLLQLGNKYRATAATFINEKSSRSHSIVSIELSVCEINGDGIDSGRRSKISLVDLAGSERVGACSNDDRHREGVSINQSLLTLGKVISALSDPKRSTTFIPYRESTLTWLLRESLGGNSLTSMLATITSASTHADETLATLRYACQARSIINRARINENPHDRLIRELRAEVERLRALRQDYERQSLTPLTQQPDDQSMQELDELRHRLSETEQNLEDAQRTWEQRFLETKQRQLQELAEAERRKEELESHVRVMTTLDENKLELSPYKSNFLEQLEDVLTSDKKYQILVQEANAWSVRHKLNIYFALDSSTVTIEEPSRNMHAVCSINHLQTVHNFNYPQDFLNSLEWKVNEKTKSVSKCNVHKSWQQICNATTALKSVVDDDEHLQAAYTQLTNALCAFEVALTKSKYRTRNMKTVKFQT